MRSPTRSRFLRALLTLFGLPLLPRYGRAAGGPADLIVTGATVHTVDDSRASAQAFAVRDGRFIFVGDTAGAMRLRGNGTRVLNLWSVRMSHNRPPAQRCGRSASVERVASNGPIQKKQ